MVLVCWPGGLLGLGHGWLHTTNSGQIPAQAQEYQGPNQHRPVGPAASLHVTGGTFNPRLRSGQVRSSDFTFVTLTGFKPAEEAAGRLASHSEA